MIKFSNVSYWASLNFSKSVPSISIPIEKSLHLTLPKKDDSPACQARSCIETNWTRLPVLLIKKWDDLPIEEVQSIFGLRSEVFIVEQECPFQDVDGRDPEADHLLLYEKNILCGYTRIFPKNTYFKEASFGRTVVKKTHRGKGFGHVLVKESLKYF